MLDNTFDQDVYQVSVGAVVEFVNNGRNPHNAFAVDGSWSTQNATGDSLMLADESAVLTFDEPGSYEFFCTIHATRQDDGSYEGMVATLVVGESDATTSQGDTDTDVVDGWTGVTRAVPSDYPTVQSGVDAAEPGDLVLVESGVYREAVSVTTPYITIRGTDRNEVILDGEFTRENGIAVTADGVAIENMTARNYTINGFFWNGVEGYRGSYLTAIDDAVYGIYAFDSIDGVLEHSYASGSWDAGFYIGQCRPCDAVVRNVLAEYNGFGYSGTNASGNIWLVDSEWRNNVAGIAPNSLDSELLPPSTGVVIAGNYVHDNGEDELAPNGGYQWTFLGTGIAVAGNRDTTVRNNLVLNNSLHGVLILPSMDRNIWLSGDNEVVDNVVRGSGGSDLVLSGFVEQGSCFADNEIRTRTPFTLGLLHNCNGLSMISPWNMAGASSALGRLAEDSFGLNTQVAHGDAPDPAMTFAQLPGGAEAPVRPAVNVFDSLDFDPDSIRTPPVPDGVQLADRRPVVLGIVLDSGFWPVTFGVLTTIVPWLAWLILSVIALWRLWRREQRTTPSRAVWTAIVVLIPLFGALAFLALGADTDRRGIRVATVAGSFVVWVGAIVGAFVAAGLI